MKAKVNVLATPHPYIFFTLQVDSMLENIHAVIYAVISELWPFTPQFQTIVNELVPCGQEGQRVEKATKIEMSSLDVEHINGTSCSDFMKVAFPLLKVYKVGKNSSVNIIFKDKKLIGEGNTYSWYVFWGAMWEELGNGLTKRLQPWRLLNL